MVEMKRLRKAGATIAGFILLLFVLLFGAGCASSNTETEQEQAPIEREAKEPEAEKPDAEKKEPELAKLQNLQVTFINVGQGDAEFLRLPDGKTMLIDAGEVVSGATVVDFLKSRGIEKIDYLVASHPHSDHIGGLADVIKGFEIGTIWMPDASVGTEIYEEFLDAVEAKGYKVKKAEAGKKIVKRKAGYTITVLGPKPGVQSDDMNAYSVVLCVTYGDTSMLFAGDADAADIVADNPGRVDVLKASHHGSETGITTELMDELRPTTVIMSYAEGNDYGHPDQSVLDTISAAGAKAYSTAANGNITVTSDGDSIDIATSKDGTIVAGISAEERQKQEEARAQAEAEAAAAAQAQAQAEAQARQQQQTVYITPTGSKYHRQGCRTMNRTKNPTPMTKQAAIDAGYQACGVCNP